MLDFALKIKGRIHVFAGGMHLYNAEREEVDSIAEYFIKSGVKKVEPVHCTGKYASRLKKTIN